MAPLIFFLCMKATYPYAIKRAGLLKQHHDINQSEQSLDIPRPMRVDQAAQGRLHTREMERRGGKL